MKKFILNGVELDVVIYPNGETDIKNSEEELHNIIKDNPVELFWYNCSIQDLFVLGKIRSITGEFDKLYIDYLPYQRSDRDFFNNCCGIESLLDLSCGIINPLLEENSTLIINDPHNEKAVKQYLPNAKFIYKCVAQLMNTRLPNLLVYPDKNAFHKYAPLFKGTALEALDFITLEKERDIQTGKIISHKINTHFDSGFGFYQRACIVDDICDYGGTFISAKKVVENKTGNIPTWWLSVSHNTECDKTELLKHFEILESL